ncbi:hypothetical protein HCH_06286 [Hahella chejuensis KCTC 2396]|uniref:Uncharacterized protein n=1 Tax=Hahella chejuensis (strain KCTC 2396) TaxID=349521 RepID=Q2S8U0_HAHCH|nr:hypothetical protein HCH_06286 [Hahella chejuensis KCTC 2396]
MSALKRLKRIDRLSTAYERLGAGVANILLYHQIKLISTDI